MTGFLFSEATAEGMLDAVDRALELWPQPLVWRRLQRAAMVQVSSWAAPAERRALSPSRPQRRLGRRRQAKTVLPPVPPERLT